MLRMALAIMLAFTVLFGALAVQGRDSPVQHKNQGGGNQQPSQGMPSITGGQPRAGHDSQSDKRTDQPTDYERQLADATEKLAQYTAWLVFATIFLALLATAQAVQVARSEKTARAAAGAAIKSSDVAEDTAMRQLRAYIAVSDCSKQSIGPNWTVRYTLENVGKTPAFNVCVRATACVRPYEMGAPLPTFSLPIERTLFGTLFPGAKDTRMAEGESLDYDPDNPGAGKDPLTQKDRALFLVVEVSYVDAFGRTHSTRRTLHSANVVELVKRDQFLVSPEGNDAT